MKSLKEKFSQRKYQVLGLVSVIILFGAVLYVSQNLEGLSSFAAASRNSVCANKWGAGWYASGNRCAFTEKLYVPVGSDGPSYCRNSGPYVPPSSDNPYGYCKKTKYAAYPSTPAPTPSPSPSPSPAPTPAPGTPPSTPSQPASLTITPKSGTAQVGVPFTATFSAGGSKGLNTWQTTSRFDNGLNFDSDVTNGILSGTPASAGYKIISIEVTDYQGTKGKVDYALTINNADGSKPVGDPPAGFISNLNPPPSSSGNNTTNSGSADVGKAFYNPITINSIPEFIVRIINILLILTGMLAVLFIIIGGLRYITSSGNPQAATAAKNTILYAILGLAFAVLSYAIVNVLTNVLINK